jgi:hypothetical protein
MNQFDDIYFAKYLSEGEELLFVCHRHPILIIDTILLWCFFGGVLPVFFYLQNTFAIADFLPLAYFELFLVSIYLSIVYLVFDWYNDVWLITNRGIIDVEWKYFTGDIHYLSYEHIHGIEIQSDSFFDSLLGKGDIHVHIASEHQKFFLADAVNPQGIVEYIQAVTEEMHHHEEEPVDDRKPFELLLDTLTEMVREHLEKKGNTPDISEDEQARIQDALRYASTVDLRELEQAPKPRINHSSHH